MEGKNMPKYRSKGKGRGNPHERAKEIILSRKRRSPIGLGKHLGEGKHLGKFSRRRGKSWNIRDAQGELKEE